jgi:hypothetical protein
MPRKVVGVSKFTEKVMAVYPEPESDSGAEDEMEE